MPRGSPQSEIDRHTYIPPEVKSALNQHFAQNVPAHLQSYAGSNSSGYMSRGMEQAISREMQRNLPSHLQKYADAYVQQNVVTPTIQARGGVVENKINTALPPRPPTPDLLRRDHNMPVGEQHTVDTNTLPVAAQSMFSSDQSAPPAGNAAAPYQETPTEPHNPYDFILNPTESPKNTVPTSLPGFSPDKTKLIFIAGVVVFLIILFAVMKSLLSGGGNTASLVKVTQDQAEIIHVVSNANQAQYINGPNTALESTMQLVITSSQKQLITYLAANGHKVSLKELDLKISLATDTNLSNAESSGNFNQVLDQVIQTQLQGYMSDLSSAYKLTKGHKGQALLKDTYRQAKLLNSQLSQTSNTPT